MDQATMAIIKNAAENEDKKPTLRTLLGEVSELAYALEGEHEHSPTLELIQIGGIALNWVRRIYRAKGYHDAGHGYL